MKGTSSAYQGSIYEITGTLDRIVDEAKKVIPEGSTYDMSPAAYTYPRVYMRYKLYPERVLTGSGDYYIDIANSFAESGSEGWQRTTLPSGVAVYAKHGVDFMVTPPATEPEPRNEALYVLLIVLLYGAIGFSIFNFFQLADLFQGSTVTALGFMYLAGVVSLNFVIWCYGILGGQITSFSVYLSAGILIFLFGVFSIRDIPRTLRSLFVKRHNVFATYIRYASVVHALAALIVVAAIVMALFYPVVHWDALSFWLIKSKAIFLHSGLDLSYTHANFYPLLWPLFIAVQFISQGFISDQSVQLHLGILISVFVTQLYGALFALTRSSSAAKFYTALYIIIFMSEVFTQARSEVMYMTFLAGLLHAVVLFDRHENSLKTLVPLSVMALGVGMTRIDGLATLVILGALLLILYLNKKRLILLWSAITALTLPLLVEFCWVIYLAFHGTLDSVASEIGGATSLAGQLVMPKFLFFLLMIPGIINHTPVYGLFIAASISLLFIARQRRSTLEIYLLLVVIGMLGMNAFVMGNWSESEILNNFNLVTDRVILRLSLFLFAAVVSIIYYQPLQGLWKIQPPKSPSSFAGSHGHDRG